MPVPLIQVVNYLCIFLRTTFIELFMSESNIGAQNYGIKRIFLLLMTAFYVLNRWTVFGKQSTRTWWSFAMKWEGWKRTSSLLRSPMFDGYCSYPPHLWIFITIVVSCEACILLGLSKATTALIAFTQWNTFADWVTFLLHNEGMECWGGSPGKYRHHAWQYATFSHLSTQIPIVDSIKLASTLCCRWRCVGGAWWLLIQASSIQAFTTECS